MKKLIRILIIFICVVFIMPSITYADNPGASVKGSFTAVNTSIGSAFDVTVKGLGVAPKNLYGILYDSKGDILDSNLVLNKFYEDSYMGAVYLTHCSDELQVGNYKISVFRDSDRKDELASCFGIVPPIINITSPKSFSIVGTDSVVIEGFIRGYDKTQQNSLKYKIGDKEAPVLIDEGGRFRFSTEIYEGRNYINLYLDFSYSQASGSNRATSYVIHSSTEGAKLISQLQDNTSVGNLIEFKIDILPLLDSWKRARLKITMTDANQIPNMSIDYYDGNMGKYTNLEFENGSAWFGPEDGFSLTDGIRYFRAQFIKPGVYKYKIELIEIGTGKKLAETEDTITASINASSYAQDNGYLFFIFEQQFTSQNDTLYAKILGADKNTIKSDLIVKRSKGQRYNQNTRKSEKIPQFELEYPEKLPDGKYVIQLYNDSNLTDVLIYVLVDIKNSEMKTIFKDSRGLRIFNSNKK